MAADQEIQPLYPKLDASDPDAIETTEIESLCLECHEMGTTRLLPTRIPLFREVIISSFECPHCGNSNSEIMEGSTLPDKGVKYTLKVANPKKDLNRLMVKANSASLLVPELEFEIPPLTQKGSINSLEGFLTMSLEELKKDQPIRKALHPDVYEKLAVFIEKLQGLLDGETQFTVILDDPSGNSFIENKMAPETDPCLVVEYYTRSAQQDAALGITPSTESTDNTSLGETDNGHNQQTTSSDTSKQQATADDDTVGNDDVMSFADTCPSCRNPVETRMKSVDIPHFKQVIIMSMVCDFCGFKSNEVKSGSGISEKGVKITFRVTDTSDLSRDILKSDTASFKIPEIELEVQSGTLGGKFSTIEGLLNNIKDQLGETNMFSLGDGADPDDKLTVFLKNLQTIIDGEKLNYHLILDDPAGNSYLQNYYAPDPDPEMKVEKYDRTPQQDEDLGIDQLKTED